MNFYVRTTGERIFNYSPLKYKILVDNNHCAGEHFLESLKLIKDEDAVLMEDDLQLCQNFEQEIEKIIEKYPNHIINFFSSPAQYFSSHFSNSFSFNQCTYYPKGILNKIIPLVEELIKNGNKETYCWYMDCAIKRLGIPIYNYRPTLVQHIDKKSLIANSRIVKWQTLYYKDYLDKIGITIEEAIYPENQKKLEMLLQQDNIRWGIQ